MLGRKPTPTGQAASNVTDRGKTLHPARKKPESEEEKTSLIAEATKVLLEFLLQNHMYSFIFYKSTSYRYHKNLRHDRSKVKRNTDLDFLKLG